jgi:DNA-binding NarL/FixJ family response regulator
MAVRAALNGETFVTPSLAGELMRRTTRRSPGDVGATLTQRQREILELMAKGMSAKEIASVLSISTRTVEFHKYQMMTAYGVHNSAELIHFAIKHGIVPI